MTGTADSDRSTVSQQIRDEARRIGFESVGIAPAGRPHSLDHFLDWLRSGYDGTMGYLSRRRQAYEHPRGVLPTAASLVMLGMTYRAADEPAFGPLSSTRADGTHPTVPARVSRYASGSGDYHDLLRERLASLADFVHDRLPGCRTRGIVDTAPLLERDFARQAGLGWFGKNTMLLSRQHGSWFFLAALLVDQPLDADKAQTDHCGTCTACLDACPTDTFTQPYVLDARRCISYLT
ncbi:MAG: tRNA epoxyqueuosine(34) reductase QueG, partial [Planctomycetaceae bacterium]